MNIRLAESKMNGVAAGLPLKKNNPNLENPAQEENIHQRTQGSVFDPKFGGLTFKHPNKSRNKENNPLMKGFGELTAHNKELEKNPHLQKLKDKEQKNDPVKEMLALANDLDITNMWAAT